MIWLIPEPGKKPILIQGLEDLEGIVPDTIQWEDCPPEEAEISGDYNCWVEITEDEIPEIIAKRLND